MVNLRQHEIRFLPFSLGHIFLRNFVFFVFSWKSWDPVRVTCVAVTFAKDGNSRTSGVEYCLMDSLRNGDTASRKQVIDPLCPRRIQSNSSICR